MIYLIQWRNKLNTFKFYVVVSLRFDAYLILLGTFNIESMAMVGDKLISGLQGTSQNYNRKISVTSMIDGKG